MWGASQSMRDGSSLGTVLADFEISLWYKIGYSKNRKLLCTGNKDFHCWAYLLDLSSFISRKTGGNQILYFKLTTGRKRVECGKLIFPTCSQPLPTGCVSDQGRQITFPSCLTPNYPSEWRERESFDKTGESTSAFLSPPGWIYQASCKFHFLLETIREHPTWTCSLGISQVHRLGCAFGSPGLCSGIESSTHLIISSLEKKGGTPCPQKCFPTRSVNVELALVFRHFQF